MSSIIKILHLVWAAYWAIVWPAIAYYSEAFIPTVYLPHVVFGIWLAFAIGLALNKPWGWWGTMVVMVAFLLFFGFILSQFLFGFWGSPEPRGSTWIYTETSLMFLLPAVAVLVFLLVHERGHFSKVSYNEFAEPAK